MSGADVEDETKMDKQTLLAVLQFLKKNKLEVCKLCHNKALT